MIDNNSTPDTQAAPSTTSPSTPSPTPETMGSGTVSAASPTPRRKGQFPRPKRYDPPAWKKMPLGMLGNGDGGLKKRWRPTAAEIAAGRPPKKTYDLLFVRAGQRSHRLYQVLFTNMVDPDKTFKVDISASSLKDLLRQIPYHVGALRYPKVSVHFTITCRAVSETEGMAEETVRLPMAEPVRADERPTFHAGEDQPLRLEE